jgi:nitrite reductase/ring-hydroxylating ferredoxin subunit
MGEWVDVAPSAALEEGGVLGLRVGDTPVALFRLDGEPFALHDLCPHGQARLSDGFVDGDCIECPLHQGLVDIRSGAPRGAPVTSPARSYPAREVDGRILVSVPGGRASATEAVRQ